MWHTLTLGLLLWQALAASMPADALTEIELVLKENVRLQKELAHAYELNDACRMELAPVIKAKNAAAVAKAEADLKARIDAAHPCCSYNIEAGTLEKRPAGAERP
jgi:hypothetical protein